MQGAPQRRQQRDRNDLDAFVRRRLALLGRGLAADTALRGVALVLVDVAGLFGNALVCEMFNHRRRWQPRDRRVAAERAMHEVARELILEGVFGRKPAFEAVVAAAAVEEGNNCDFGRMNCEQRRDEGIGAELAS